MTEKGEEKKMASRVARKPKCFSAVEVLTLEQKIDKPVMPPLPALPSVDRPVMIDLSSSDEEEGDEMAEKGEEKKMASRVARKLKCFSAVEVLTLEEKIREDDECCILTFDPFNPTDPFAAVVNRRLSLAEAEEELYVIAERGMVACKDYPHSRHQCGENPFDKTSHESCCAQCYCYVCDAAAPCMFWEEASSGHCHASDKESKWQNLRCSNRTGQQNIKQDVSCLLMLS